MLSEGEAYEVTQQLEGVITQGTGAGYTYMGCPSEAGKTGTSEGESDAWFVGYTPMFSTAVWVGHPQSREATGFGGPTAGPIWRAYMESAQEGECPEFEVPESLPELSALDSSHTSSSGYSGEYEEEPYEYEAEEETEDEGAEKKEGDEGGEEDTPEATPAPTPAPSAPSGGGGGGISPG